MAFLSLATAAEARRFKRDALASPLSILALTCALGLQTAANWVLRESKSVYRAASEGVINLADKFFEMERADALRWEPRHAPLAGFWLGGTAGWVRLRSRLLGTRPRRPAGVPGPMKAGWQGWWLQLDQPSQLACMLVSGPGVSRVVGL